MKGARFVLPGCTGFHRNHPEWGELEVQGMRHYSVICVKEGEDLPHYIPMRDFIVLDYPKENCKKGEEKN